MDIFQWSGRRVGSGLNLPDPDGHGQPKGPGLGGFLGGSAGRTPLGQPDPETWTGRTKPQMLTQKPESDEQQLPRAGPTLSETNVGGYELDPGWFYTLQR